MKKLIYVFTLILLLAACGNDEAKDQTNYAKTTPGEITHQPLKINLAVRAEQTIEQALDITDIKVKESDITAEKLDAQTGVDGTKYDNVYLAKGKFIWKSEKFDFEWMVSFDENNTSERGKHLRFDSTHPNTNPFGYGIELK